jgi:antitoxin (DNA-binding transcriptional repressor) of toxin-antitoxin stability system
MYEVNLDEAKTSLLNLIDAAIKGEEVFIKDDQRIVQLVPAEEPKRHPRFGSARGLVAMADDFDAPLADFEEYML